MLQPQSKDEAYQEWVLLAYGKNVRTIVGYKLSEIFGMEWTPKYKYVNLILNGDYKGCYILMQPIEHFQQESNFSSSGFIIENDAYWWAEEDNMYFKSENLMPNMAYTFTLPAADKITKSQRNSIENYIATVEELIYSDNPECFDYIDEQSFASWLLVHDIIGCSDGAGTNMFLYKKDLEVGNPLSSELRMGPLWDFDTAFKLQNQWSHFHNYNLLYFPQLLKFPEFKLVYKDKWEAVSDSLESEISNYLNDMISEYAPALDESWRLDSARWGISYYPFEQTCYDAELWLSQQIQWINSAIKDL